MNTSRGRVCWAWVVAGVAVLCGLAQGGCAPLKSVPGETVIPPEGTTLPVVRCGNTYLVRAELDGKGPYFLLLDTGAGLTIVDPLVAGQLGSAAAGTTDVTAVGATGNERTTRKVRVGTLRAGGFEVRDVEALVLETARFGYALGHRIDGVLGFPAFRDVTLTIDYPAEEVRVTREVLDPDDAGTVAMRTVDVPRIDANVAGVTRLVMLDSGSNGGLTLSRLDELPLEAPARPVRGTMGVGGVATEEAARLAGPVVLGPLLIDRPVVSGGRTDIVGVEVLGAAAVTFDQRQRLVRFANVRATGEEGSSAVGLGVVFSFQETSWRVESVIAGGPAEAAGVRPGDLVEAINGRAIAALGCDERRELRDAGQVLTLLLRREGESLLLAVKMATLVP